MKFADYYTLLEQTDIERLEEKVFISNFIKEIGQQFGYEPKTLKVDPNDYDWTEISQTGYNKLTEMLRQSVLQYKNNRGKKNKAQIVAFYQGKVDDTEGFPEDFPDNVEKISAAIFGVLPKQGLLSKLMKTVAAVTTFGLTNINYDQVQAQGSTIVLLRLEDASGDDRYYIGHGGKGQTYWKDILGVDLETYLASNRPGKSGEGLEVRRKPEQFEPETEESSLDIVKGLWPESTQYDLDESKGVDELKIFAGNFGGQGAGWYRYQSPKQMFRLSVENYGELGEVIKKKLKPEFQKDFSGAQGNFIVVDPKTGEEDVSKTNKVRKLIDEEPNTRFPWNKIDEPDKPENDDPTDEPKTEDPPKEEPNAEDPPKEDTPNEEPKSVSPDVKGGYHYIKKDIKSTLKLKPTDAIKQGYMYTLNGGGQFFAYITTNGTPKIAYDKKGKEYLANKKIIEPMANVNLK